MPVTFGSVGDIIAVCLLVKDLVEALDKARGSKVEYQSAIRELWILDRTLLEIELLTKEYEKSSTAELRGLCETAKIAAVRCKTLISTFLERIKKYQTTFDENQSPGIIKGVVTSVRWRIGEKDALEQFRVEIAGTSSSLQMLLTTASVTLMDVNRRETEQRFESFGRQSEQSSAQQTEAIGQIREHIKNTQQQIDSVNTLLHQISNTLRLDWLHQLGTELKSLMQRAIAINIATYHAVLSIQTALPSRLERRLIDEPFILEDPIGRIAPIHLQFVTSWEAFHAVMELRFSNMQGFRKMQERQYGLQDGATRREIEQTRPWQRAFLPGQRVEMAFVFQSDELQDPDAPSATCPGCQTISLDPSDAEIQCQKCSIRYRRITVVEEVGPWSPIDRLEPWSMINRRTPRSPIDRVKPLWLDPRPDFGLSECRTNFWNLPPVDHKGKFPYDWEGEDDIREFKRVRLMQTKRLVKQLPNSDMEILDPMMELKRLMNGLEGKDGTPPTLGDGISIDGEVSRYRAGLWESLFESAEPAGKPKSVCPESVSSKEFTRSPDEPSVVHCPFNDCKAAFHGEFSRGNLGRHVRRKHRGLAGGFLCAQPQCGQTFNRFGLRIKHYRKHHPWFASEKPTRLRQGDIKEEL